MTSAGEMRHTQVGTRSATGCTLEAVGPVPAWSVRSRPVAVAVLLASLTVVACSGDDDAAAPPTTTTTAPSTTGTEPPTTTTTEPTGLHLAGPVPATDICPAVPAMTRPAADRPR